MSTCGIYKITNLANNKAYIGQSVAIEKRWTKHRSAKDEYPIHRAMRKYGLENFSFEIIEKCSQEKLNEREKFWISYYETLNPEKGYNLSLGGNARAFIQKVTPAIYYEIVEHLRNKELTQKEIGELYNISENMVVGINTGYYWKKEDMEYPIRKFTVRKIKTTKNTSLEKEKIVIVSKGAEKIKKKCVDCGKEIKTNAERCPDCAAFRSRKVKHPTREELKQLIRTTPFTKIGEKYGVTDNAIRKWCDKFNLPRKASEIKKYSDEEWKTI